MEFEDQFPWPCRPIGDMLETNIDYRGKTPPKSETGIPTLTAGNVKDGKIDMTKVSYVSQETYEEWTTRGFPEPGDVLITLEAPVGEVASFPGDQTYLITRRIIALRGKKDELDNDFLKYSLLCPFNRDRLLTLSRGTTVERILKTDLTDLQIPAPPIEEQRAIASILGALDDKIELNRRMNATLESLARAIFKSWFVDFDPVKINAGQMPASSQALATHDPKVLDLFPSTFQDSELGPIPEGWEIKRLEELTTEIGSGATPRGGAKVYVEEGVALVRSQNVFDYEFVWDGLARITDEAAKKLEKLTLQENDILFNITGASILRTCIVDPRILPARVNQHVARIRAANGISPNYLHEYMVRKEMKDEMIGLNAGATREAVTKGHLQNLRIIAPPPEVLHAFDESTQPLYQSKQDANAESSILARLRDTLLPQLLSGELPVPEAVTATEEALV